MFRTPLEQRIAELRYVEGKSYEAIGEIVDRDRTNVSRTCRTLEQGLRQIGVDLGRPEIVREAVAAILRRCRSLIAA